MKDKIIDYAMSQGASPGETIEYGWFIFNIVADGDKLSLESLDFKEMASFTKDISAAESIHNQQTKMLEDNNENPEWCNLRQFALTSKSIGTKTEGLFLSRTGPTEGNNSGWFVGIEDDDVDINDPNNITPVSLYELSIKHAELTPFWLLPAGYTIQFKIGRIEIIKA